MVRRTKGSIGEEGKEGKEEEEEGKEKNWKKDVEYLIQYACLLSGEEKFLLSTVLAF